MVDLLSALLSLHRARQTDPLVYATQAQHSSLAALTWYLSCDTVGRRGMNARLQAELRRVNLSQPRYEKRKSTPRGPARNLLRYECTHLLLSSTNLLDLPTVTYVLIRGRSTWGNG
jgi:hypothetical protein